MDGSMTKSLVVAGAAGLAGLGPLDTASVYLLGVPVHVIFMSLLGAALSYAFQIEGEAPAPKRKMYFSVAANTMLASACVAVLPGLLGWDWYSSKVEGSVALLFAASARFTIPLLIKTFPEIIRKWFRVGEYNVNKKAQNEDQQL
jgi:hypothetical protein